MRRQRRRRTGQVHQPTRRWVYAPPLGLTRATACTCGTILARDGADPGRVAAALTHHRSHGTR